MIVNFYLRRLQQAFQLRRRQRASLADVDKRCNTVVFFIDHELARTQIYPLAFYASDIRQQTGAQVCYVPTDTLAGSGPLPVAPHIRQVFVQAPLNADATHVVQLMQRIQQGCPNAAICYLDWMAPIDIRHAAALDPYVSSYITKQTFRDPADFHRSWVGDSNLSDHYFRAMDKPMAEARYGFPEGFESKVILGSNFGFSPQMLDMFLRSRHGGSERDIDFHARIATKGVDWYAHMRTEAYQAAKAITGVKSVIDGRVKRTEFFAEMYRSKLCFSPFGYGEVCWRDYEAFATGAVLLKPNVDHLRTFPDVFVPGETYVSLRWDLADLQEQVQRLLQDAPARARISAAAFDVMHRHIAERSPMQPFLAVLGRGRA